MAVFLREPIAATPPKLGLADRLRPRRHPRPCPQQTDISRGYRPRGQMARKRRKYTLGFKQEAVRLVTHEGMTFAQFGQDLGVNKSTSRDWCLRS